VAAIDHRAIELHRARSRAWLDPKYFILGAAAVIVAWLALVPLIFLLWQSFTTPLSANAPAELTLMNYARVYGSAQSFRLFGNSLAFAGGASLPRSSSAPRSPG